MMDFATVVVLPDAGCGRHAQEIDSMSKHVWKVAVVVALSIIGWAIWLGTRPGRPVFQLSRLDIDPARIAIVGFSSGAAMAQQVHLAYSDRISGVVLVSGPPYQCAEGSLQLALSRCMKDAAPGIDVARLAQRVQERASSGDLAPLEGLAGDRVVVIHGRGDALVPEATARAALDLYAALPVASQMSLRWDGSGEFAHVWPTLDAGGECGATAAPYIGHCDRDLAGETMEALYGAPPGPATTATGDLRLVDLGRFSPAGIDPLLDGIGYQYLPRQCVAGERCGVLIAFHGCEQNSATVGEAFVRDAGFNRWADVHSVTVLYPQTRATYLPLNPKACWDWWGYSGADYDTRDGLQLRAVAGMAAALGAPLTD
jgi:hypothetical protein